MDNLIDQFRKEWISGKYKKYNECPSYTILKNKLDSINKLNKEQGWRTITIEEILQ